MSPLLVSAIAVAVILFVALIVVAILWVRRPSHVPPAAPPMAMSSPAPCPYEDERESQASYFEHGPHPDGPSAAYRQTHDVRANRAPPFRHRDAFESDRVDPFDPHEGSPPRSANSVPLSDAAHSMFRQPLATDPPHAASGGASLGCPQCGSMEISTLNVARIAGSTIGSVAGATSGFAMALSGAEAGAAVGAIGGPIGAVFGGFTGAVLAGLLGSAAGNAAGSAVGAAIDENMLDNYRCLSCGHTFGALHG